MTRCYAEIRNFYLPDDERVRYVLSHGHWFLAEHKTHPYYIEINKKNKREE